MVRNISTKYELPPNPTFKEFERSDGNPSLWPANTQRVVDKDGQVNYMEYLPLDHPTAIHWRTGVAKALSKALNWPAGSSYALGGWPAGYRLFCHNKGPEKSPRQDVYLFGSRATNKFRSVNEFIPHARWLFEDAAMNPANCECKYCSKKSQREITANMGNEGIIEVPSFIQSVVSSSPANPRRPPKTAREPIAHYGVQKAPKALRRSIHSQTSMQLRRWCRNDEVVWCALNTPITGPHGNAIRFWPSLIEDTTVKILAQPNSTTSENQAGPSCEKSDDPPWDVTQYTVYKVKLLAVACTWNVPDHQVLPYQAYHPPQSLLDAIDEMPSSSLNFDRESCSQFNPCPDMESPRSSSAAPISFENAAGPFAVAVQIAAQVSRFWGLSDPWEFAYSIPQSSSSWGSSHPQNSAPPTLQEVITSAGASNAAAVNSRPPLPQPPPNQYEADISASRPISPSRYNQVLGVPNPLSPDTGPSHTITQTRYQGMWWGPERIWADDFVRIKMPRSALAPNGAKHIFPPSGPSKSVVKLYQENSPDGPPAESILGAQSRGIFMRLDSLVLVDVPTYDGDGARGKTTKECRATGMLYELADQDWEESGQISDNFKDSNGISTSRASSSFGEPNTNLLQNFGEMSLPQPSTLEPTVLPNPDPTVPVEATSLDILSQQTPSEGRPRRSVGGSSPKEHTSITEQLSRPSTSNSFLMPAAPTGYKFRPILEEGYEAVFSLVLISGRYYPGILNHPLLDESLEMATQALVKPIQVDGDDTDSDGVKQYDALWALEGLTAGYRNSVDPAHYKMTRKKMVDDADKVARAELNEYKANRGRGEGTSGMEIDDPQPPTENHVPMELDAPF
ncbi:hypothetical protein E1B28_007286 [Marasmius oreades]|uniref:Cryptic loci regulator 2 N-terminal domain-containing protein n=1 Tax=Marasmius oreades TaxID=181124 RepID=A0A9P7S1Z8_9AGAR|nr:uncharacterized protein E1B28_007286 [Marasmius oreades]KAG7093622.1 hypothetical protein E1B28_007286 [Marasmius oreades]